MKDEPETLFEGDHLCFRRSRGWEYVEHRKAREAVMVVAITVQDELVLADEFRPAVGARVISLPAGLVGDLQEEKLEDAARRELREETGYEAAELTMLGRGPGSAGASSEIVTFFLALGAERAGDQAPEDRKIIRVHAVPIVRLPSWSREREGLGDLVDPKVWAGLYLAATAGVTAAGRAGGS